jgi:hypothetical protein
VLLSTPDEIADRRKYGKGITISFDIADAPVANVSALVRMTGIRASLLSRLS